MAEATFDKQWDEAINRIRFVAGKISRHEESSEDGVRTYGVSEIPGELHAYTFFPTLVPRDLLKGQAHIDAMFRQDVFEQEQLGLAVPTEEDYQRFFKLSEEIIELSV